MSQETSGAGDQVVEQFPLARLAEALELDEDAEVVETEAEDVGNGEEAGEDAAALQAAQAVAQALLGLSQLGRQPGEALAAVQAQLAQQGQVGLIGIFIHIHLFNY